MGIVMVFILTWQQINFLKKDSRENLERIRESESKIRDMEYKIKGLEREVERMKK